MRCRCFELPPTSKFLILRVWTGWCAKRTQGLYWFRQNVPMSSSLLLLVLLALKVHSWGYKRPREGRVPSLWWCVAMSSDRFGFESSSDVFGCGIHRPMPFNGTSCFSFYRPRKSRGYSGGKRWEMRRRRSPLGSPSPPSLLCGSRWPCRCQHG